MIMKMFSEKIKSYMSHKIFAVLSINILLTTILGGCSFGLSDLTIDYVQVVVRHEVVSESENNEPLYTCILSAEIHNNYALPLTNVKISLIIPSEVEVNEDKSEYDDKVISIGDTTIYSWDVKIPVTTEDRNIEYSVVVTSDVSSEVIGYDSIFIDGLNANNNRLDFQKDTWNFKNFGMKRVPSLQADWDALLYHLSPEEKEMIKNSVNIGRKGNCFGMSVTAILAKLNRLSLEGLVPSGNAIPANLHSVVQSETANSAIGYYQIMQKLNPIRDIIVGYLQMDEAAKLIELSAKAQAVEEGGNPVLLCFYFDDGGHAVIAYGFEEATAGHLFRKNGKDYDSRICIYDNNSPIWTDDVYLYFNKGKDDWIIPEYNTINDHRLGGIISEVEYMDFMNRDVNRKSVNTYIEARKAIDLLIEINGTSYTVNGTHTSGNNDIIAYYDLSGADDAVLNIAIRKPKDSIESQIRVATQNQNEQIDIAVIYESFYLKASAKTADAVLFEPTGGIGIDGHAKEFSLILTGNDVRDVLQWDTIKITGSSANSPKIDITPDGYILSGTDFKGLRVKASHDTDANEVAIKTSKDKVLISSDGTNLIASIDQDGDFRYEEVIAVGKKVLPDDFFAENDKFSNGWWKSLLGILGGLAVVSGTVVLFFKRRGIKNRNKRKGKKDDEFKW
jgi:hypothetical protein